MENIKNLNEKSCEIRKSIVQMLMEAGSGHLGGSLGLADIFTALYFQVLNHNPNNPRWEKRDRLVLSIGHVAPLLYATLAHAGYFPIEELSTLRKLGSRLQGHPALAHGIPGLETSSGSLGQGLSIGVGMALAANQKKQNHKIYTIHGDGEMQEGAIWEAAMSAAHYKLNNLIAIVDKNGVQIDGRTSSVMNIDPLPEKFRAFGWEVIECEGNNMTDILAAFEKAKKTTLKPTAIVAHTSMGAGIEEIQGDYQWHGKAPSKEEAKRFIEKICKNV